MVRRFSLKFKTGPAAGQSYSVGPGEYFFIGSGENCVIRIKEDPSVSGTHACIYHDPAGFIRFKDMGSQFGTFKNGKKISGAVVLKPGDRITIGQISTFQSAWWNALQMTRLTRFSVLPQGLALDRSEGSLTELFSNKSVLIGMCLAFVLVSAVAFRGDLWNLATRRDLVVEAGPVDGAVRSPRESGDLGIFSGALSAKLFFSKPKKVARARVEITPERRFIWDEIVAISRRFGDPPPTAMDPRFVREVERHLKNFTRGGYHKQLLERKQLMWPEIEKGLILKGLPVELGFIVWVESNFQRDALSPVGAFGPWQFMPETAREYKLTVSSKLDERKDLARSTVAAADYFTDLLRMFGTERYLLAVASYNTGQNRVKRLQIAATVNKERSSDFWHLRSMLPKETAEYVPKFMAAVIIGRNPGRWDVSH
jgi:hypothetical protein